MFSRAGRLFRAALLAALLSGAVSGCGGDDGDRDMDAAWQLVMARDFDGALPLVKTRLERHPGDPAAHYLLGKCHLHRQNANTTIALGEFETALLFFDLPEGPELLGGRMEPDAFRAAVHRDAGLSLMRALYEAADRGLPPSLMGTVIERALAHVNRGLESAPEDEYLREMRETLLQHTPNPPDAGLQREITI